MGLVNYSSSESSEEEAPKPLNSESAGTKLIPTKRRKHKSTSIVELPPLPKAFHNLYATNVRTSISDDPSLHGGRKRAVPHIEGNWPSHVYVEWYPTQDQSEILQAVIPSNLGVQSSLFSDLSVPLPLHISLSRSLNLATAQKESFLTTLRSAILSTEISCFQLIARNLSWVSNFEGTRWFLVLKLKESNNEGAHNCIGQQHESCPGLNKLLVACNNTAVAFGQPWLYLPPPEKSPRGSSKRPRHEYEHFLYSKDQASVQDATDRFHISIAWSLEKPDGADEVTDSSKEAHEKLNSLHVPVDSIKAKIGNQVTAIELGSTSTSARANMLGSHER